MNVATSIVVFVFSNLRGSTDALSIALARPFPTTHQLRRWPCIRYPVPYHSRKQLPLRVRGGRPGGKRPKMSHGFGPFNLCILQGTYWYHSHFQNQYCDGLRGALVVYDPEDPHREHYDIDDGEREING
jgi:Multicopper oxidase